MKLVHAMDYEGVQVWALSSLMGLGSTTGSHGIFSIQSKSDIKNWQMLVTTVCLEAGYVSFYENSTTQSTKFSFGPSPELP